MRVAVVGGSGVSGRRVVEALRAGGHEPVVISRSNGVDARTGKGLDAALEGVGAVVDTTNPGVNEEVAATAFFTDVAANLQRAGAAAGVGHLVVLSIVGVDHPDAGRFGFYAANLRHEEAGGLGEVPVTVVRATQFHEFPAQVLKRMRKGPVAVVPRMLSQTVAAATVGSVLAEVATGTPTGATVMLAGPGPAAAVPDLARRVLDRLGLRAAVVGVPLPGRAGRAMRTGALLPPEGARIAGPSFDDWLTGGDVLAVGA